jgi:hydroxyacylglutathione hydrolase
MMSLRVLQRRLLSTAATMGHSRRTETQLSSKLNVVTVPVLKDNYAYVVYESESKRAAAIDVGDAAPVAATIADMKLHLDTILCTHHHSDHIGGVPALREAHPKARVLASDERVPNCDEIVGHNHTMHIGEQLLVRTLMVPCHTRLHCAFHVRDASAVAGDDEAVFVGDTLFVGGCGRFFEGTAQDMYSAMFDTLFALPANTLLFCGHEYAEANLKFALGLEPDNGRVSEMAARVAARRNQKLPAVPQLLHNELLHNPFARCRERAIAKRLGFLEWSAADRNTHIAVLDQLRTMKNDSSL